MLSEVLFVVMMLVSMVVNGAAGAGCCIGDDVVADVDGVGIVDCDGDILIVMVSGVCGCAIGVCGSIVFGVWLY